MMSKIIKSVCDKIGLEVRRADRSFFVLDPDFEKIYKSCRPFTMTSLERMYALYKATEYVVKAQIAGDVVECGVWKGGSAMLVALALRRFGCTDKKIYLYDTFEGMTEPSELDIDARGQKAGEFFAKTKKVDGSDWCNSPLDEVKNNLLSTGYPVENMVFVKGKVQNTIPSQAPARISILRLDTDWYDSTYHEMKHLYPLLIKGGVLVLDDYGYWQGARMAVDKYFAENRQAMLLNKIDFSGRIGVKC